jgi:phosphatidate phosphatase APP1
MNAWRGRLLRVVEGAEASFDRAKLFLKVRHGLLNPVRVLPYRGHGTPEEVRVVGRVLEEKMISEPSIHDSRWQNLRAMAGRFLSSEVPGARVRASFGGADRVVVADDEGFFEARVRPREPAPDDREWHDVDLELLWPKAKGQHEVRATGKAMLPARGLEGASFGVISDIDDTILRSDVTSLLTMLRLLLFSNAHTRLPFEGVAAFYRALRSGSGRETNPIFYVSTGPWNLYDLLEDFLEIQGIPAGPIFLKDWGGLKDVLRGMDHRSHKLGVIRGLMDAHADLPFVLVGDSGQEDAETYAQIAAEYPERILAVYIRDVRREGRSGIVREIAEEVRALGIPMLLVDDTVAAAEHAASAGLIDAAFLPEVRRDREADARAALLPWETP